MTRDSLLLHHSTRKSVGYFGAVSLRDSGFVFRREAGKINGEIVFAFLNYLLRVGKSPGRLVVNIVDNARYHHARLHKEWREEHSASFSLDFLPPYNPQLNPIERVSKLTWRMSTHNRYFSSLDQIAGAVEPQTWKTRNDPLENMRK